MENEFFLGSHISLTEEKKISESSRIMMGNKALPLNIQRLTYQETDIKTIG